MDTPTASDEREMNDVSSRALSGSSEEEHFGLPHFAGIRAWINLVRLCLQRQAHARQMVWIALGLLALTTTIVALNTAAGRWNMSGWRFPHRQDPSFQEWLERTAKSQGTIVINPTRPSGSQIGRSTEVPILVNPFPRRALLQGPITSSIQAVLERSGFYVFSSSIVFSIFLSFLLPIWSLSFATEALGGEREARTLIWLLTRPMSRPAIYLAKFVALLPWSLGLNLGGFGVLCFAAGPPGHLAFRLYWPAVFWASLAFCSLFHLMGACFRRSAVVAIVYSFFLETILGNMPGYMKRVSISFYTRCMMFEKAQELGVQAEKPSVYLPVDGTTAWCVLAGLTAGLLVAGMIVFARSEYQDLT